MGTPASAVDEAQIGAQVYRDLAKKGAIVATSPWYVVLNQTGAKIATVANRQYAYPFRFVLVKEPQPNAFAAPGGNIYVTLPMMTFIKKKEQFAGVLSHEVAHDIHHDVLTINQKAQTTSMIAAGLSMLIGGGANPAVNGVLGSGAQLASLNYSRSAEAGADKAGARIAATAGYNPWGMIWLFQAFSRANTAIRTGSRLSKRCSAASPERSDALTKIYRLGMPCRRFRHCKSSTATPRLWPLLSAPVTEAYLFRAARRRMNEHLASMGRTHFAASD